MLTQFYYYLLHLTSLFCLIFGYLGSNYLRAQDLFPKKGSWEFSGNINFFARSGVDGQMVSSPNFWDGQILFGLKTEYYFANDISIGISPEVNYSFSFTDWYQQGYQYWQNLSLFPTLSLGYILNKQENLNHYISAFGGVSVTKYNDVLRLFKNNNFGFTYLVKFKSTNYSINFGPTILYGSEKSIDERSARKYIRFYAGFSFSYYFL